MNRAIPLFDPSRCIYVIAVENDQQLPLSPFGGLDAGLFRTARALHVVGLLPVSVYELIALNQWSGIRFEGIPNQVVSYFFAEQWDEPTIQKQVDRYPFLVCFDFRSDRARWTERPGHVRLFEDDLNPDIVLNRWRVEGVDAVSRVASMWPPEAITYLADFATRLKQHGLSPSLGPALPAVTQDCLLPTALIRNLNRGHWGRAARNEGAEAEPIDLRNPQNIQREQCRLADEIHFPDTPPNEQPAFEEAVLIAPSVNPRLAGPIKHFSRKAGIESVTTAITEQAGYLFEIRRGDVTDEKRAGLILGAVGLRGSEHKFYDGVALCRAAPGRRPVFRTPRVPMSFIERLGALGQMTWDQGTIHRSMHRWETYCADLTVAIGKEFIEWIASRARRIVTFSDLPIEWCRVDGVPLGFLMPVSRIPLSPGSLLTRQISDPRPPVIWTTAAKLKVTIVSGHSRGDPLGHMPRILASQIQDLGFQVVYGEVSNGDELREQVARDRPNILFLSTHGTMTRDLGAALHFERGPDALRMEHFGGPEVAIVSACRSDPVAGTYGSPVTNLYGSGIRAVLGSYLNLTEPHAMMVARSLFGNLAATLAGKGPRSGNWQDLVWLTLNTRRPIDVLVGAHRWLKRRADDTGDVIQLLDEYAAVHKNEPLPFSKCWDVVPERLRRIAKGTRFERAIEAVTKRHAFRSESVFYTHVGSPHAIVFNPTTPAAPGTAR